MTVKTPSKYKIVEKQQQYFQFNQSLQFLSAIEKNLKPLKSLKFAIAEQRKDHTGFYSLIMSLKGRQRKEVLKITSFIKGIAYCTHTPKAAIRKAAEKLGIDPAILVKVVKHITSNVP